MKKVRTAAVSSKKLQVLASPVPEFGHQNSTCRMEGTGVGFDVCQAVFGPNDVMIGHSGTSCEASWTMEDG
jgi:hypothetical protein